jgi:hypothetical protein
LKNFGTAQLMKAIETWHETLLRWLDWRGWELDSAVENCGMNLIRRGSLESKGTHLQCRA